ncbi:claudin-23-like [Genypterus blacodes]|uniref:claudin-23-like n=1 Tax=Genypterus blacodes TaxID=154954 RepID=UPI003F773157
MSRRSTRELSCRFPGLLIVGSVLAPCGLILDLTATVSPNWRTLHGIPTSPPNLIIRQGIWDICRTFTTSTEKVCDQPDPTYFNNEVINVAQGLMVASLIVTLVGLAISLPGVRCWGDKPSWVVVGLGGLFIFASGVMTIIPIAWYTHFLQTLTTVTVSNDIRVGYCIFLGFIGGIFEVLSGFIMIIGICSCKIKKKSERRVEEVTSAPLSNQQPLPGYSDVTSLSRSQSSTSIVTYSKDSLDEAVSFPRAKNPAVRAYSSGPYDVDL